jgi:hypothetical protein
MLSKRKLAGVVSENACRPGADTQAEQERSGCLGARKERMHRQVNRLLHRQCEELLEMHPALRQVLSVS